MIPEKPAHAFVHLLFIGCLLLFPGRGHADLVGGIEIGGSSVKGFLYRNIVLPDNEQSPLSKLEVTYGGVGVISALSENSISSEAIELISQQVQQMTSLFITRGVPKSEIYVVGSSSVEKMNYAGELFEAITAATSLHPTFVSAEQEALFGFLDAIDEDPDRESVKRNSIYIDIGAGNLKAAYIDGNRVHTIEIPYGTDNVGTLRENDSENPSDSCSGWKVQTCFLKNYFATVVTKLVDAHPGFRDRGRYPHVYLTGGTAWATARLTHFADTVQTYTPLTYADFRQALTRAGAVDRTIKANLAAARRDFQRGRYSVGDNGDLEKQASRVIDVYGKKQRQLKDGISLYLWFLELLGRNHGNDHFTEMNRQGNWLRYYVMAKKGIATGLTVPEYHPTFSLRSNDIER